MSKPSIRIRLTLGMLLILVPFLFALSHLLMAARHLNHPQAEPNPDGLHLLYNLSGVATITFAVGVWLIVGRTLSPIRNLAEQARASRPERGTAPLVPPSRDPEIVELVDTLNDLLHRVTEAGEAKSRFYVAVSHELRTPLQALSGHLELASSRPRSQDEYAGVVAEAQEQTRRLVTLVEGVLLLHRIESGGDAEPETARVDLVADRLLEGERVTWLAKDPLEVQGFSAHLEILVSNLVTNALRHGSPGEAIVVTVRSEGGGKLLISNAVADPTVDVDALNEPFATSKRARTADSGNGLGIPVVQAICRRNGWYLTFERSGTHLTAQVDFKAG